MTSEEQQAFDVLQSRVWELERQYRCPIGLDDSPLICSAGTCAVCKQMMLEHGRDEDAKTIATLRAELAETWETIVYSEGILIRDGDKAGWHDSCANSDVCHAGHSLVKFGTWEIHPGGVGRRQFYRPLAAVAAAAKETTDASNVPE